MALIENTVMPVNSGSTFVVNKGQHIRISAQSAVSIVSFNIDNLTERFDQGRTRANQQKIYLGTGDTLYSRLNRPMLMITEDTYKQGHHDLLYGHCGGPLWDMRWEKRNEPPFKDVFKQFGITRREELPMWGCEENLMKALRGYPILPVDIPGGFNIVWSMEVDPAGKIVWHIDRDRPEEPVNVELQAEMNCLCALSVCPEWGAHGHAKPARVQVFEN